MLTLYVDLGSAHPCFALIRDGGCLRIQDIADHKDESALMPTIEALLQVHGLHWQSIDRIALMAGPGGFMSLRVGAALVNAMSFALSVPSASVHASDVWSARAALTRARVRGNSGNHADFLWLHSTKKTQLFVRGFGSFASEWPEAVLIDLEALISALRKQDAAFSDSAQNDIAYVGELIPEHQAALPVQMIEDLKPLEGALPDVLAKLMYRPNQTLLPWYGREG